MVVGCDDCAVMMTMVLMMMMAAQGLKRVRVLVTMMVMTVMVVPKMTIMNIVQENIVLMTSTTRMTFVSCLYDVCFRFRSVVVVVVAVAAVPSHPHLCGHPCSQHVYDAINKNVAVLLGNPSRSVKQAAKVSTQKLGSMRSSK